MNLYNKKVLKLLQNKNFRNSQNYVIRKYNSLENDFFDWSFIIYKMLKIQNGIYYYNWNSFFYKLFNWWKAKNSVFFYSRTNNFNKYLIVKKTFISNSIK
jgi:hypothetical protein